jgi:predicted enzyme related to lactoylglutathione lyase
MKMNPVIHFEMPAEDTKRVSQFYTSVFGWENKIMGEDMGNYVVAMTTDSDKNGPQKTRCYQWRLFSQNQC